MGADCKSAGDAYAGSNPARPKLFHRVPSNSLFKKYIMYICKNVHNRIIILVNFFFSSQKYLKN